MVMRLPFSDSPWPDHQCKNVLFILDAANEIEEQLLKDWLSTSRDSTAFSGKFTEVVLPIAVAPESIPSAQLSPVVNLSDDTLLVPVRTAWLSARDSAGKMPRLRDLALGNARRPWAWRARRIARAHPERVNFLVAEV